MYNKPEPMSQTLIMQSNSYLQSHEEKWVTIQCIEDQKKIAYHMLSWCKRVRDRFDHYDDDDDVDDDDESKISEPNSIIGLDNLNTINQHYSTWESHVKVWRVRFNKVHGITA